MFDLNSKYIHAYPPANYLHNKTIQQLSRLYPRPSPYIQSNLHKFGTGPAATAFSLLNQMPIQNRKLNLNSSQYFKKSCNAVQTCYCCLEAIEQQFIDNVEKYLGMAKIQQQNQTKSVNFQNQIGNQPSQSQKTVNYSQTSLLKYFGNTKNTNKIQTQQYKQKQEACQQKQKQQMPTCSDCFKNICVNCSRICSKCHKLVCKFDFKEDNSLGLHNCN